jgi:polyhydroxybutyrate depolymerase
MPDRVRFRIPREYRVPLVSIAVGLALFCVTIATALAGESRTLNVDGVERSYYVHVPAGLRPGAPLVLVLHGAGGSGELAVRLYRWQAKADAEGFLVAGPDALPPFPGRAADFLTNPRFWNDGSGRGAANVRLADDVAFVAALIDALARGHGSDRARVYVTGFSSGAGMANRLGQEMADRIAAIAPVAGILPSLRPSLARPVPVLYVSGDRDPLNPVAGGDIALPWGNRYRKEPIQTGIDRWRDLDGCTGRPENAAPTSLRVQSWSACRGNVEVRYVLVLDHGHEWPGGERSRLPASVVGPFNATAYDATSSLWRFFQRWRLS